MKAIASDFDGTLYFENGFKEADLKSIQNFQKAGNYFGVCTGRPLKGILYASKEAIQQNKIQFDFFIVSTGAIILDAHLHVIYEKTMPFIIADQIVETYKENYQVYAHVGLEDIYAIQQTGGFPIPQNVVNSLQEVKKDSILGISIEAKEEKIAQRIYQELQEKYGDTLSINLNASDIDIVNKGVSKGQACQIIKEKLGVQTLYGIGDNYNDIPMLLHTDASYTFTYSPESVQKQANKVVCSIEEMIQDIIAQG